MRLWDLRALYYGFARTIWPTSAILRKEFENIQSLFKLIDHNKGLILDIGCGVGESIKLLDENVTAIAIDARLKMAKKINKDTVVVGDALRLPVKPAKADFVLSVGLSEYLDDLRSFFRQISQTLKSNRCLILTTSPPTIYSFLRFLAGSRIYPRKTADILAMAQKYNFEKIGEKHVFSQDVFLFRLVKENKI